MNETQRDWLTAQSTAYMVTTDEDEFIGKINILSIEEARTATPITVRRMVTLAKNELNITLRARRLAAKLQELEAPRIMEGRIWKYFVDCSDVYDELNNEGGRYNDQREEGHQSEGLPF
ncbi:hypothetical protein ACOMHN_067698 [Nucella lapillus]